MLYPKIKIRKEKNRECFINIVNSIKNVIVSGIRVLKNREYFILFVKKSFHF